MDVPIRDQGVYRFGSYRLDPVRRILLRDGVQVKLPARLFDLLLYLVRNHDRLVERDELLRAVWGGRTVAEGNLGQAISSLRKALPGDAATPDFIVTAAGRGYRFGAPVVFEPFGLDGAAQAANGAGGVAAVPRRRLRFVVPGVVCLGLAAAGAALWLAQRAERPGQAAFAPPPHSVAVMAFTNMSGDAGQDYFSDGLSEELIGALSRIGSMHVAARLSAFSFKGRPVTVGQIARQLNVGAVLDGSVRRVGARLRITAELVDARSGFQIWTQSYDRDQGDVLNVQGEIAAAVTSALRVTLLGDDAARVAAGGTQNAKAFDAYLRGVKLSHAGEPEADRASVAAFDEAIALDPGYALARAHRAAALRAMVDFAENPDLAWAGRMEDEAVAEAERAVRLAPELGAAHAALGAALEEVRFDFSRAAAELSRARELAPSDVVTNVAYADLQLHLGHMQEAVSAGTLTASLDPLTPETYRNLASILSFARRYDEALTALRHAQQLEPAPTTQDLDLRGEVELEMGDPAAARKTCAGGRDWGQLQCLAIAEHALGNTADAAAHMAKLRAMLGDSGAMQYAQVYAQWGQIADSVAWLQTAWRLHDPGLIELKVIPALDPVRGTPEYKEIEQRLGFPA
jgi:TolB-like protein/DNA-binding winged helix-turn-helix (wHTH) protein/tetratricopeptide (TPR) repeat protein